MKAYERLMIARKKGRPTAIAFIENLFDGFFELHGDRLFGDDPAIVSGIAAFEGLPVTVVGIEKGVDTQDKVRRNFGAAHPEGYRKALRLLKQAEKFHRPAILFVDTSGAYCGIGAEERGQGSAIAQNLMQLMQLQTPLISIVIGEGGSGGALALAVADQVWMLENAVYSVISPEGMASILYKDASRAKEASEALKMTAQDLYSFGVAERIFAENGDDFSGVYREIREALREALHCAPDMEALLERRYEKFRKIGRMDA